MKKESKWPDYLFTIAVRFVCGVVLGGLACFAFTSSGILRAFANNHLSGPLIWLGICGVVGGFIGAFTVPHWQTPWYKRDQEELDVMAELGSQGRDWNKPSSKFVKKSVQIKTTGEDGEQHEYSSMEDVPPEIRKEIETLEREAMEEKGKEWSVKETSQKGDTFTSKVIRQKEVSLYKIIDESGVERIYHSLEEMPPDIRAAFAEVEGKSQG